MFNIYEHMQYVLFTSLENLDYDSELEDTQISTVSRWEVKSVESTQHIFKKNWNH